VTGRPVDAPSFAPERRGRSRVVVALVLLLPLAVGVLIGSRIASRGERAVAPVTSTVTVTAPSGASPTAKAAVPRLPSSYARSRAGAVAAAAAYLRALDGPALLDAGRVREVVARIASRRVRAALEASYARASAEARRRLGVGTTPRPVVILRAAPVGYRLERWSPRAATVSVWRVGIVGSGATVTPQQSWRTETVELVWEDGRWKVASFASAPGPTPPLPASATPATELFAAIPRFDDLADAGR